MAPKLKISHLGKTFNDLHALQDVNLDVERGEFISVVGPSGCGKTTFLRIVAGLEPASGPRVAQRNFAAAARRFANVSSFVERMTSVATSE